MEGKYDLTKPQESIILTEKYYKNKAINNIGTVAYINEKFDPEILRLAIELVYDKYDSFNIQVGYSDGKFYQTFGDFTKHMDIPIKSLKTKKEIDNTILEVINTPFDIEHSLTRAVVFVSGNNKGGFVSSAHHLITDGLSSYNVGSEVLNTYEILYGFQKFLINEKNRSHAGILNIIQDTKDEDDSIVDYAAILYAMDYLRDLADIKHEKEDHEDFAILKDINQCKEDKEVFNKTLELGIFSIPRHILKQIIYLAQNPDIYEKILNQLSGNEAKSKSKKGNLTIKDVQKCIKCTDDDVQKILGSKTIDEAIHKYTYTILLEKEKEYEQKAQKEKDEQFWKEQLEKNPKIVSIANKNVKALKEDDDLTLAGRFEAALDKRFARKLLKYCKEQNISVFNFMMGVYSLYISGVSFENCFAIGTPILNRSSFIEKKIPGMFASTMPYIVDIDYNQTFEEFFKQVKLDSAKIFRHQKYPYSSILKMSNQMQDTNTNLYNVLISYQIAQESLNVKNPQKTTMHWHHSKYNADELDIHIYSTTTEDELYVTYDYQISKFNKEDIENIHKRVIEMSKDILDKKYAKLKEVEVTTKEERHEIFTKYNLRGEFKKDYHKVDPKENIMIGIMKNIASLTNQNKIAMSYENQGQVFNITYKELLYILYERYNHLKKLGIKEKDKVAIFATTTADSVINMLTVMLRGATYIPIDRKYPQERVAYILEDSNTKLVLATKEDQEILNTLEVVKEGKVLVDDITVKKEIDKDDIKKLSDYVAFYEKVQKNLRKYTNNLAYIIYTSGSTSNPKGVKLPVYALNKYITWAKDTYSKIGRSNYPLYSSISFDLTITSIYTPLYTSNTMYIYPQKDDNVLKTLTSIMENQNLDVLKLTPAHLKLVANMSDDILKKTTIKKMILGGDILEISICDYMTSKIKGLQIYNEYGPTETAVGIMEHIYSKKDKQYASVPIGIPAKNSLIYLTNQNGKVVPNGVYGQITIETKGMFKGYVNLEEKTKAVLSNSQYTKNKCYFTGDIAFIHPKSNLMEYIGRKDFQVKINGYRIDLGEITARFANYDAVKEVYTKVDEINGKKAIVVYYSRDEKANKNDIKEYLKEYLPKYMIPEIYIHLEKMPLTINGKIDKLKLPKASELKEKIVKPTTQLEKTILKALLKMQENLDEKTKLKEDQISITEDIFSYGIDSLDIINLQMILATQFGINLQIQDFYDYTTIQEIAKYAQEKHEASDEQIKELEKYKDLSKFVKKQKQDNKKDEKDKNTVWIFGTTGFVGSHLLKSFMENTSYNVVTVTREKGGKDPKQRIQEKIEYYFGKDFFKKYQKRIIVLKGDLLKENLGLNEQEAKKYIDDAKVVISTAAIVKHFGDKEQFIKTNVDGTNKIIDFCQKYNIPFNYVSTLTVSGYGMVDILNDEKIDFDENKLYINQKYEDNVYVMSKFLSEKNIIDRVANGDINASILRIGNITNRQEDCKFQENESENAFVNRLMSIIETKTVPEGVLQETVEFSPVDVTATIIQNLSTTMPNNLNIYHITNDNQVTFKEIVDVWNKYLQEQGKEQIQVVPNQTYMAKIMENSSKYYGVINYMKVFNEKQQGKQTPDITMSCKKTKKHLNDDIKFKKPSDEYLVGIYEFIEKLV